ncbi:MAG: hypothetical protein PUF65_04050 [Lachnospiraceae bacterium]|nr:hypothetical protein [Lachnospiraceae bacterium]
MVPTQMLANEVRMECICTMRRRGPLAGEFLGTYADAGERSSHGMHLHHEKEIPKRWQH